MTQDVAQEATAGPVPSEADICALMDELQVAPGRNIISLLQQVQERLGYLPAPALAELGRRMKMPLSRVYGVVTFYAQFYTEPRGRHTVRCCRGTACHVKGINRVLEAVERHLGIRDGDSTPDLAFHLETVSCLGACGLAPVMVIDETVYGQITPDRAVKVLDGILASEANGHD